MIAAVPATARDFTRAAFVVAGVEPAGADLTGAALMITTVLTAACNLAAAALVITGISPTCTDVSGLAFLIAAGLLATNDCSIPKFNVAAVSGNAPFLLAPCGGERQSPTEGLRLIGVGAWHASSGF